MAVPERYQGMAMPNRHKGCCETSIEDWIELNQFKDDDTLKEKEIKVVGRFLVCVEKVTVRPPRGRVNADDGLSIYGQISFNDDLARPPVTLFNRPIHHPQRVTPDHDMCLSLSDDDSDRPICSWGPLYATLRLYEKKSDDDEDELIADVKNFLQWKDLASQSTWFDIKCHSGYVFRVSYAVVQGSRVHVDLVPLHHVVPIIPEEDDEDPSEPEYSESESEPEYSESEDEFPIPEGELVWAHAEATQRLCRDKRPLRLKLNKEYREADMGLLAVRKGQPICLDRKVVHVCLDTQPCLCTVLTLLGTDGTEHMFRLKLPFPTLRTYGNDFITNNQLTHTHQLPGTSFSVSVKFVY